MQPNQIDIWRTDHGINETVSRSLLSGIPHSFLRHTSMLHTNYKCNPCVAYGILRGTADAFKRCNDYGVDWWEVDRGFFKPNHFDGYYRISYKDMQPKYQDINTPSNRFDALHLEIAPWRKGGDYILVCPPTEYIKQFYRLDGWLEDTIEILEKYTDRAIKVRDKGADRPLEWDIKHAYCVVVCNSNVGIDALLTGVPVIADNFSVVNGWNNLCLASIEKDLTAFDRQKLFNYLAYCQFTLEEIEYGIAWKTVNEIQKSSLPNAIGTERIPVAGSSSLRNQRL